MEMKIVIGIAPIILIIYLAIRDFFFFSSKISSSNIIHVLPDHHHDDQNHQSSSFSIYNQILIYAKPSYLFIFFTFNILLVAALLGISSQLSKSSATTMGSHVEELSLSSLIDSYEGLKGEKDGEDYCKDDRFIPAIVCVHHGYDQEEEEEKANGINFFFKNDEVYGYVDEEYYKKKDDFFPGIVHVEYKEEKVEVEGQISNVTDEKDLILISGEEEDYGYDEDYSEIDDIDLNKRIEEFIDENNKKWKEELQNDMWLQLY